MVYKAKALEHIKKNWNHKDSHAFVRCMSVYNEVNVGNQTLRPAVLGVRRAKAVLYQWVRDPPYFS